MAVRIRLQRHGRKNRPFYRIVATDSRSPRDGRTIEALGTYDPMQTQKGEMIQFDAERVKYWISVGAKPSETMTSIFKKFGIVMPWVAAQAAAKMRRKAVVNQAKGKTAKSADEKAAARAKGKISKDAKKAAAEAVAKQPKDVDAASKKAKRDAKKAGA